MLIRINGRLRYFRNLDNVTKTKRPGHWLVQRNGRFYEIEGGRPAGGTSRQWFVTCPETWSGAIHTTSLVDSLNLIDTA